MRHISTLKMEEFQHSHIVLNFSIFKCVENWQSIAILYYYCYYILKKGSQEESKYSCSLSRGGSFAVRHNISALLKQEAVLKGKVVGCVNSGLIWGRYMMHLRVCMDMS